MKCIFDSNAAVVKCGGGSSRNVCNESDYHCYDVFVLMIKHILQDEVALVVTVVLETITTRRRRQR